MTVLRVTVDDQPFTVSYSDVTADQVREWNRLVGRVTLQQALRDPSTHDLDVVAAFVWLTMPAGTPPEPIFRSLTLDAVCVIELDDEPEEETDG